ncbi:ribosome small subunit-dependent GTPase A [Actinomycetospora lutea]|uniref:ribosome small subunit-dependent GTPase A n=1 Tax=Actinomycetospora lutea TaxID=663604 RepID=UPI0023654A02|nr:ribosome small subunit-dependent GTPase A [Actinomycetospora lutea]MDD7940045.1 ribosome small subunit-dependent GTPase A [Actinomycetospora lutea]
MTPSGSRGGGRGATSRLDESDVRVRPGRGTRPRSKRRPEHADATEAMVVGVDRGRWTCAPDEDPQRRVVAMRARELGRTPVVVGDRVGLVGDVSGGEDALARIVRVAERRSVLRRTADDTDPYERVVVANASHLVIVTALADPPPRTGFVDRALVAAYAGGLEPVLCLTKADLADPAEFAANYAALDLTVVVTRADRDPVALREVVEDRVSALIGHSGVGKSTLVNALVPDADRAVGEVSGVGKGRHTSTSAVALALPELPGDGAERGSSRHVSGWVIDTPGIRSFGLAHIAPDDVVAAFGDLAAAIEECPRGCGHLGPPADPECALDAEVAAGRLSPARLEALRRVLEALRTPAWET